jgi:hypothetical protein
LAPTRTARFWSRPGAGLLPRRLRLDLDDDAQAAGVLAVAPAALLHPVVPQPDGTVLYELLTGHPDRAAHELVFLPDLTVELRAWPTDARVSLGVHPRR